MRRKRSLSSMIVALCALILATGTSAKTIYVDDDAPLGGDGASWATAYRFLQDGLARAADEDEVRVGQGEYKPDRSASNPKGTRDRGTSFEVATGVHLRGGFAGFGADDPNACDTASYACILSGDLDSDDLPVSDPCDLMAAPSRLDNAYHVVRLLGGVLEGVEITGGYAHRYPSRIPYTTWFTTDHAGGGVWGDGTIRDSVVRGNYAEELGGGLWYDGYRDETEPNVVHVENCRFIGNAARHWGGGLCLMDSIARLRGCEIQSNWAGQYGGGADLYLSSTNAVNCRFVQNETAMSGGGVSSRGHFYDQGRSEFWECSFALNRAGFGGAVFSGNSECKFDGCEMRENRGTVGGAFGSNVSIWTLRNTLVHGNWATQYGGAACIRQESSLRCQNCTVVNNVAPEGSCFAIGINSPHRNAEAVDLLNCVIDNEGQELWNYDGDIYIDHTNLMVERRTWYDPCDMIILGEGNVDGAPCFVDSGYWDGNDTPDDTNDDTYVAGDYHLKSQAGRWDSASESWVQDDVTSPCIDAGDPNSPIMYEPFPNGGIINMGAYGGTVEASRSYFGDPVCETIIAGDINGDCRVDLDDLILLLSNWTNQ